MGKGDNGRTLAGHEPGEITEEKALFSLLCRQKRRHLSQIPSMASVAKEEIREEDVMESC